MPDVRVPVEAASNDPDEHAEALAFRGRLIDDLRRATSFAHDALRLRFADAAAPPDQEHAFALAAMVALHAHTGDDTLLERAQHDMLLLVERAAGPDGSARPFLSSLRHLLPFCEAYGAMRDRLTAAERAQVEAQIAASASSKLDYLDWGPHNRAVVDGASLLWAAKVAPGHPDAGTWRRYGAALLEDSWGRWSIEDASIYTPLWIVYLLTAAEATGRDGELLGFITTRYYFDYWCRLLMPNGMLPDFGDADWTLSWEWYVAAMVRAGSHYGDGRYLWFARRVYDRHASYESITTPEGPKHGAPLEPYPTYCAALALRWLDVTVPLRPYAPERSEEVLEDLVGKKVVFRSAAQRGAVYALLNYRDEGPYARPARDYLNQQLAAYEEKPHHGHADENSLAVLMVDGTVLLHDGGYRLGITPEAYRADYFHNRLVARTGFPVEGDVFDYAAQNKMYARVETEKVHFGTFGVLDYSRTRLRDAEAGYTADRVVLFAPLDEYAVVVDAVRVDRAGHKTFLNVWHPSAVLHQGDGYVVSWPPHVPIRRERWHNPHTRDLLIQFLDTRDKPGHVKQIQRAFAPSTVFYQSLWGHFFAGQRLTFVTVLSPHPPASFTESLLRRVRADPGPDHRSLALSLTLDGCPATVGLKLDSTIGLANLRGRPMFDVDAGTLDYGPLATDADFAFALDRGGEVEYGFAGAARLRYGGATLFETPVSQRFFQWFIEGGVATPRDKMPRYHARAAKPPPAGTGG